MAKRRRLEPARRVTEKEASISESASRMQIIAPVAEVAADASASAALSEMADTLRQAREQGRMIVALPLEQLDLGHLVRDRLAVDDDDMTALVESLRQRGQQTPIEVTPLEGGRYGLISGWRRCCALSKLQQETEDPRFETVLAVLRQHTQASDSYVAMVEENEIRANLSFYERARIVAKSVENSVYPSETEALRGLFGAAPRARRSKIKTFLQLVMELDDVLQFPSAISEKLGLEMAKALRDVPGVSEMLSTELSQAKNATVEVEQSLIRDVLDRALGDVTPKTAPKTTQKPTPRTSEDTAAVEASPGVFVAQRKEGRLAIFGDKVTPELTRDLMSWLKQRG